MNKTLTRGEILFFAAYIFYFAVNMIKRTGILNLILIPNVLGLLEILSVFIVALKILSEKAYKNRDFIVIVFTILLIFISCVCNANFDLFFSVCFMIGMKDISYQKMLKVTFLIQIVIFITIAAGILTKTIPNQLTGTMVWANTIIDDNAVGRYNLGFSHPNVASGVVLFSTLVYMCLRNRCSLAELFIALTVNYLVYQKTGSRTCFLMILVFLPFMYWFSNKKNMQKYWRVLLTIAPVIIILTAVFAQIFYNENNALLAKINTLLSGRLNLGHGGWLKYGITLFGQKITWIVNLGGEQGRPYDYVDSAYMRVLLENGLLVFILLCIMSVVTMRRFVRAGNGKFCIAFLALLVHAMVEISIYYR